MPPSTPFVDRVDGTLDTTQIITEAIPLAKLIGFFVAIALVPFALAVLLGPRSGFAMLFTLVGQFVIAVGTGIVLMYCIVRGNQLISNEQEREPR